MTIKQLSDGNPDGTTMGQGATDKIAFYGVSVIAQQSSSNFADASFAATTSGFGYPTATAFNTAQSQLQQVVTALKALGLVAAS